MVAELIPSHQQDSEHTEGSGGGGGGGSALCLLPAAVIVQSPHRSSGELSPEV